MTVTSHTILDASLVACIAAVVGLYGDPCGLAQGLLEFLRAFPDHYKPVFDFVAEPMNPLLAVCLWFVDVYFLLKTYYLEKLTVTNAHKKYKAHRTTIAVAIHGLGSAVELTVGLLAVLAHAKVAPTAAGWLGISTSPEANSHLPQSLGLAHLVALLSPWKDQLAQATAFLALFVNVPSGLVLNPNVFGVKHLTVPGFLLFGFLRTMEGLRVLMVSHALVTNLWILLKVGTVVRLLGWFVLPYTSVDGGRRGDLFTEPVVYSFNILLSGYLTAAFVYPPKYLLGTLVLYPLWYPWYPPRLSVKRLPGLAAASMSGSGQGSPATRES